MNNERTSQRARHSNLAGVKGKLFIINYLIINYLQKMCNGMLRLPLSGHALSATARNITKFVIWYFNRYVFHTHKFKNFSCTHTILNCSVFQAALQMPLNANAHAALWQANMPPSRGAACGRTVRATHSLRRTRQSLWTNVPRNFKVPNC